MHLHIVYPLCINLISSDNLDTLKIDTSLPGIYTADETAESVDDKIIQTIQAIDKNINSIVQAKTT